MAEMTYKEFEARYIDYMQPKRPDGTPRRPSFYNCRCDKCNADSDSTDCIEDWEHVCDDEFVKILRCPECKTEMRERVVPLPEELERIEYVIVEIYKGSLK